MLRKNLIKELEISDWTNLVTKDAKERRVKHGKKYGISVKTFEIKIEIFRNNIYKT